MRSLSPPQQNYRSVLEAKFTERLARNPKYSLRAFARDLSLSSARLSEILSGKKGLSRQAAQQIARRLGMSEKEQETFCDRVDAEHCRSPLGRKAAQARLVQQHSERSRDLTVDHFQLIENWYHLAILQYLKIWPDLARPQDMAQKLEISENEAKLALGRLERLDLIEKTPSGGYRVLQDWVTSGGRAPSASVKKFHRQVLQRAQQALDTRQFEQRQFRTTVFPARIRDLPEIQARIDAFSKSLIKEFSVGARDSDVFALGVQVFPLSRPEEEEKNE
jgi:uncharacterized protein (TIGR02147 family)